MFALEIRFLTGRYAAGRHDDASKPEWPPHPARIYSALTAAFHEGDGEADPDERRAMEWLASDAGLPEIAAPGQNPRQLGQVFVPVNDPSGLDSIDKHLLAYAEAAAAVEASDGKQRDRAMRKKARAEERLRERSAASAVSSRSGPSSAAKLLDRPRHPRSFPVALPTDDVVFVAWPTTPPDGVSAALDRLCSRVARLGHSSSLVSMRVVDRPPEIPADFFHWVADPGGADFIRIPHDDQLRLLEDAYAVHQAVEARVLPARSLPYARSTGSTRPDDLPASDFSAAEQEWIVYRVVPGPDGAERNLLDISLGQQVARALRGTLLSALDGPSELLSGHDDGGDPTERTHVAYVPLPFVGHRFATGTILGVAIVPPRSLDRRGRDALLEAVFRAEQREAERPDGARTARLRLTLGRAGVVHLERVREPEGTETLEPNRWCRVARRWATATAIALDRNPGNLLSRDEHEAARATSTAEEIIAESCVNVGLPRPDAVWIHKRSLVRGAPAARRFAPFPAGGGGPQRVCIHAEIDFGRPVRGPVLLGAGRYFGLGLAVPVDHAEEREG